MELIVLKYTVVVVIGFMLGMLLKRINEAQEDLESLKISWQQYSLLKQAAVGLAFVGLFLGFAICSL